MRNCGAWNKFQTLKKETYQHLMDYSCPSLTQPGRPALFFLFMNTRERLCVTPQKCAACGLVSSPPPSLRCPLRGASAAGDVPKQLLALPNGPGCRWCSCKSPPINKKKARRQLTAFFESPLPGLVFMTNSKQVSASNEDPPPPFCRRYK